MEDFGKFQQMQDEMSRFEAEISGSERAGLGVIGAGTYSAVQQQLERVPPPPQPPRMLPPAAFFPPGASPIMIPASVQRLRPMGAEGFPGQISMSFMRPGPPPMGPGPQMGSGPQMGPGGLGMGPGPQIGPGGMPMSPLMMPPQPAPKPQPVVLSSAPKLYKKPKQDDEQKKEKDKERKKKRKEQKPPPSPPPPLPSPPAAPPTATATAPAPGHADPQPKAKKEKKNRKVVRTAGGTVWEDVTLLEWPDDDFRVFCGDLGNDVTDDLLARTFGKYASFQRARVVRDKRTNKSRGFGFVSFKDPQDFIKAMKEMDGRYVGSRPIKLRKSTWRSRALDVVRKKEKEKAALLAQLIGTHS